MPVTVVHTQSDTNHSLGGSWPLRTIHSCVHQQAHSTVASSCDCMSSQDVHYEQDFVWKDLQISGHQCLAYNARLLSLHPGVFPGGLCRSQEWQRQEACNEWHCMGHALRRRFPIVVRARLINPYKLKLSLASNLVFMTFSAR